MVAQFFCSEFPVFLVEVTNGAKIRNLGSLSMSDSPFIYHDLGIFATKLGPVFASFLLMMKVHFGTETMNEGAIK